MNWQPDPSELDDEDPEPEDDTDPSTIPRYERPAWTPNRIDPPSRANWALGEAVLVFIIRRGWTHAVLVQEVLALRGLPKVTREGDTTRKIREQIESNLARLIGGTGTVTSEFITEIEVVLGCDLNFLKNYAAHVYRTGNLSVFAFARNHLPGSEFAGPRVWEEIREQHVLYAVTNRTLIHSAFSATGRAISRALLASYLEGKTWLPIPMQVAMAECCALSNSPVPVHIRLQLEEESLPARVKRYAVAPATTHSKGRSPVRGTIGAPGSIGMNTQDQKVIAPLGACLRAVRLALGKSQGDVSRALGQNPKTIALYEHDEARPSPIRLSSILAWLTTEASEQQRSLTITYYEVRPTKRYRAYAVTAEGDRIKSMTLSGRPENTGQTLTVIVEIPDEPIVKGR